MLYNPVCHMKSPNSNIISVLLALFMWSQILSLCGALDSLNATCLDDIEPEEIVTLDPFLASTQPREDSDVEALHQPIDSAAGCGATFLAQSKNELVSAEPQLMRSQLFGSDRLWLLQRRLLI